MSQSVRNDAIEAKRRQVLEAYLKHGVGSSEYEEAFDELHDMRMDAMAEGYRHERGLPPGAKTPYCGSRWSQKKERSAAQVEIMGKTEVEPGHEPVQRIGLSPKR